MPVAIENNETTEGLTNALGRIETFVKAVDSLSAKAARAKAGSLARGWGKAPGEHSVYRGSSTVDEVLDLHIIASEACMQNCIEECEKFLTMISKRPGAVTCEEVETFCNSVRELATT